MATDAGHSINSGFRVASLVSVLLVAASSLILTRNQAKVPNGRPKIGLVMSGEGAIGFAQIGVLRWFEEKHIPVDYIAGSSVGGFVAGAYATGMSPAEIDRFVENMDFTVSLFFGDDPYQEKGNWTKSEKIKLPGVPELQIDPFMASKSPAAIVPLLPEVAKSYTNLRSFDDLPTPFRCQATDLASGEMVILNSGSLPEALRACITLIGISNPVRQGNRLLISGAILDSVPTDVVRQMGADLVIASFIPPSNFYEGSGRGSELSSPLQQMARSLDIARLQNERRSLQKADITIRADRMSFTIADFSVIHQVVEQGYHAAQAKASSLMLYSLSESEWMEYLDKRNSLRRR